MKKLTVCVSALYLAAVAVAGCSSIEVDRIAGDKPVTATGVVYALPATVIRTALKIDRQEKSGAPYARFAAIFVPESKPVCPDEECASDEKVAFSVAQGATISTYGEPDTAQIFLVRFSGGGAIDQSLSMSWNEAGLLSSASATVTNRTVDVVTSGIKMATGLGAKFAGGAARAEISKQSACPESAAVDAWVLPILRTDPDVGVARLLVENYCNIKVQARAGWPNTDDNKKLLSAALSAYVRSIQPLAKAREGILDGTSSSVDQANLLAKLETEIDAAITRYFIGKTTTKTWAGVLDTRDVKADSILPLTIVLLKLDPKKGICLQRGALPPDAQPIPKDFLLQGADCGAVARTINLKVDFYPEQAKQLFTKITDDTQGKRSFRYRIPAHVSATIDDGSGGTAGAAVLSVAQLGRVISLPAGRHSKSLTYELGFIEATGALKTFKLGTTGGLDSSTVDALNGAAGTAADARNAARKSEQDLAVLTQQDQLLKLRDDICTIQKKYGINCTVAP